nr:doublesex and mab-3 related transcription factor B1b [Acipenser schrenckii]
MPHRPNPDIAEKRLRTPKCARCRNHGFTVQLKGHSGKCAFMHCQCWKCALIAERTQIMAVQRRMKKEQKEQTNNAAECEPAPPAQGPRLAGRRKQDKSRNIDEDCREAEPAGATSARLLNKYEPRPAGESAAQDCPWRGEGGVTRAAVNAGTSRQFDAGRMHTAFGVSAPVQTAAPETALSRASSGVYEARAPMHSCAEGSPGMDFHTGADWPERDGAAWSSGGWAAGGMQGNAFRMAPRYVPDGELLSAVHRPVPVKLYSRYPCHAIFLNVAAGQPCFHEPPLPWVSITSQDTACSTPWILHKAVAEPATTHLHQCGRASFRTLLTAFIQTASLRERRKRLQVSAGARTLMSFPWGLRRLLRKTAVNNRIIH